MRSGYLIIDLPLMLVHFTIVLTVELLGSLLPSSLPIFKQQRLNGKIVLLTGAGSGIGRETSLELCRQGCTLVLWDVDEAGNEETHRMIREMGGRAYPSTVDVSDRDALEAAAENAVREHGRIDILVCNAGILHPCRLYKIQHHEIEQLMAVNFLSIVQLTKFFLRRMIEQGDGHIVCISSSNALRGSTHSADYSASKSALSIYFVSLMQELDRISCSNVHVTVVYPYFVNTPLIRSFNKYFKYLNPRDASKVAKQIVNGVRTCKQFIHIPSTIRLMSFINFLSPITFNNMVFDFHLKEKFDPIQSDEKFDSY